MNKAITDGIVLMPPAFAQGLSVWARGDGTAGSATYAGTATAAYVPADLDFGGCLEIQKTESTQKLRYMGRTPLQPGCYLRIRARIKAMSGALPTVRIAGWAGGAGNAHVPGLNETGNPVSLTTYGDIIEVSAIVGSGQRSGVDMVWGRAPYYGHFGLDLTGPNGGVVRIDDIVIEDITSAFHRKMMNIVDVTDYGAIGDGATDNHAAFVAANAAADGRRIFVPDGEFYIGSSLTLNARMEFDGRLKMDAGSILSLTRDFDLPKYIDAFGGDEELAFRKAFQALLNNVDHETLDLGGRRVTITQPLDMQAIEGTRTSFAQRRVIRNGQLYVQAGPAWDTSLTFSAASYSASNSTRLTGVDGIAGIKVGSKVGGIGVGREVYVREVNVAAGEIRLSAPLWGAAGRQIYSFHRFKYVFDFTGFEKFSSLVLMDLEFLCRGYASGIALPVTGVANTIKNCFINRPKDRGITSIGQGCQGLFVEGCQFITNEGGLTTQNRTSIALNANAHDQKIRNNRASQFKHFAVIGGQNCLITGNHFFQGDSVAGGGRSAGLVFPRTNTNHSVTANYVDNCSIEWTNEASASPAYTGGFSFSNLSVTNNVFLCGNVSPSFAFMSVKPYGAGHSIKGLTMTGNSFRVIGGSINRVEKADGSIAALDPTGMKNIEISANTFANISQHTTNPVTKLFKQSTPARVWSVPFSHELAFGGRTKKVTSLTHTDRPRTRANATIYNSPFLKLEQGVGSAYVTLDWGAEVRGGVTITARMDK